MGADMLQLGSEWEEKNANKNVLFDMHGDSLQSQSKDRLSSGCKVVLCSVYNE